MSSGSLAKGESIWPFKASILKRSRKRKITAVVLGSGGARGWAHIGVLKAFRELDLKPDLVAGASIGAVAAAVYAADALDELIKFSEDFDWLKATQLFFEFGVHRSGFTEGRKVVDFLESIIKTENIEDLPIPFAAVATDLFTSEEVVFKSGSLIQALRSSISIPGIFTPVRVGSRFLVDGGLVNPLPLNVVREMGATHIIAVNINNNLKLEGREEAPEPSKRRKHDDALDMNLFDVFTRSLRIAEDKITIECIRNSPPDVLIEPAVGDLSTMDFSRSADAIKAGYDAAMAALR